MKPLTITAPSSGISASPHIGFADVRNLDIYTSPGVVKLNNLTVKKSSTTVTDLPLWAVSNPATPAEKYKIDASGNVYKSSNSGAAWALMLGNVFTVTIASPGVFTDVAHGLTTNDTVKFTTTGALPTGLTAGTTYHVIAAGLTADAFEVSATQGGAAINTSGSQSGVHSVLPTLGKNGSGLAIWKNYLFVTRAARIDVCGDGTATGIANNKWTFNWQTIDSDLLWHHMIVSKNDNKLYGGAGRYVFSLDEVSAQTFAPATAATFTFTSQAVDLPPNYRIKCLEELGNNLMCGTWQGTNVYDLRIADIFPWDRSAPSFGQPITLNEHGVHGMLNTGNQLIVLAGIGGTVYKCDGVNAYPVAQIPEHIASLAGGKYLEWYPGALVNYKGRPFFGVSGGGTTAIPGMGVYSLLRTSKGNILVDEHTISSGNDGTSKILKIGALLPVTRDNILIGWRDDTTYGIDNITTTSYKTTYTGYFDSPLYQIGENNEEGKFQEIEFLLARPMRTNEGIKVAYRKDLTASFTDIVTFDYTKVGANVSYHQVLNSAHDIKAGELCQIRVYLTGTTTALELKSVTLR